MKWTWYQIRVAVPVTVGIIFLAVGAFTQELARILGNVASLWAFLVFSLFILRNIQTRWWRSLLGIVIMGLAFLFAQVFLYIASVSILGPYLSSIWFRLIVYTQAAVLGTLLTVSLYHVQKEATKNESRVGNGN